MLIDRWPITNIRENLKFFSLIYLFLSLQCCLGCDIWKTSECPSPPSKDDEEVMKADLYSKEQLYAYCDKGKTYADCVNERLRCCDLRPEYISQLAAADAKLKQNAWRIGKYCSGIGESNAINYKCKTTTPPTTTTTTQSTTTPMPICAVEEAGTRCGKFLENRVRFETTWNIYEKAQWCKDTLDYYQCANRYITNCSIVEVKEDVDQLTTFMDYIEKSANRECPGGLFGCDINMHDVRCRIGVGLNFLQQNCHSIQA
ncbi:unnamed protein product [Didymodactylos carnosus]|uniref:Uncharacterized protein n=2 Tax=Didymodactylos carnosus TaxID=1234261 RepID=A0A813SI30_9BILA|nr:unnamed protein product [Didymodactylos carnosus]CAF3579950.1 unnamed protein product [Didymodactylos carnosus]